MPRFYCPSTLPLSGEFSLPPEAAHHAARVLRLRVGENVEIFDGLGQARSGVIADICGKHVTVGELTDRSDNCESPLSITLAQSLPSGDKMDWVIQKATELGVAAIQPLASARSVVKLSAERAAKRQEHWQQVAISACEQCGRNQLPLIHPVQDLADWVSQHRAARRYIFLPQGAQALQDQPAPDGPVELLIGAEGGFTEAESALALHHGYTPIRLGPRILRTETAALAGITALQYQWGDFRA